MFFFMFLISWFYLSSGLKNIANNGNSITYFLCCSALFFRIKSLLDSNCQNSLQLETVRLKVLKLCIKLRLRPPKVSKLKQIIRLQLTSSKPNKVGKSI